MEESRLWMGETLLTLKPSHRQHPEGHMLYEVYAEGDYVGLVADTGQELGSNPQEGDWRPFEGESNRIGEALDRDSALASFIRQDTISAEEAN